MNVVMIVENQNLSPYVVNGKSFVSTKTEYNTGIVKLCYGFRLEASRGILFSIDLFSLSRQVVSLKFTEFAELCQTSFRP